MNDELRVRHSEAKSASLISDPVAKAEKEAANALRQADRVKDLIIQSIDRGGLFKLRPSTLLDLNRCAIEGLDAYAGSWRPGGVKINKSKHVPPDGHLVAELVEDLCDYVNGQWNRCSAIHLASIVMWRLNWIHPFTEGNGRTSRAASYLVLCAKEQILLPGGYSIPEQIVENRTPYYEALEDGDKNYENNGRTLNAEVVPAMERLLAGMLARQLTARHKNATE
ncbi:Fic family protein [Marivita sp.]|uniref:Fic family protein n=1 Tax=Marivita sp. TaxID=2003365 RepID=UPI003A8C78A0